MRGSARHGLRRPALVSSAERRIAAVRGVPGLQAGPRPQRLSVTGAFAEPGAAACAPGAKPPAPRAPCSGPTFPSPPDAEGTARRHKVEGAQQRQTVPERLCPGHHATFYGAGSLGSRSLEKRFEEMGLEQRLVQKCAAAAPPDSVQSPRALRFLCKTRDAFW